jgi:hypothetical protein
VTHRRIPSATFDITLRTPRPDKTVDERVVTAHLAYVDGRLHEIGFVGRGKIGSGLDHMLLDLGVGLSRAIQGRHPDTGDPIE